MTTWANRILNWIDPVELISEDATVFDEEGNPNFQCAAKRTTVPESGSTNHPHSFRLDVGAALSVVNVALIAVLDQTFDSGDQTAHGIAFEGFVKAGGDGTTTGMLSAVVGQFTVYDAAALTWGVNVRGGALNRNGASTGTLTNAAQFYATSISFGSNRYGLYIEEISGGVGENYAIKSLSGEVFLARQSNGAHLTLNVPDTDSIRAMIDLKRNEEMRWRFGADGTAESGANAGNDFSFFAYDDTGAFIGTPLAITRSSMKVKTAAELEIDGALNHDGATVGFYGTTPIAKQTGVAVSDAAIHAALVALGLIAA